MPKVTLGEVAAESKETCKGDKSGYPVVGLEHITPGEITLTNWAENGENTFTKLFRKGDMLFGRRRAYLKKAAVAPFDGICSGDITVIRALPDKIVPELLPFIIQSEDFFDFAVGHSAGSLSPRVKWEHLKNYKFTLPPLAKQRELAEVLWAIEDTRTAYQHLEQAMDELVKARFIEMFGDPVTNSKKYPVYKLSDITTSRLGKMLDKKRQTGKKYPYLANCNVQWFRFELDNLNEMDFDEADRQEFELRNGDLLVCEGGEVGRCAIWREEKENCYFQKALHRVRCNMEYVIPEYLVYTFFLHSQYNGFIDAMSGVSTIAHLPGDKLKQLQIIVPPVDLQNQFAAFVEQVDKSKLAVYSMVEKNADIKAAVLREWLR